MNKSKGLAEYEEISIKRIKNLIQTRCGGSQKKFAEKTGLNIGSVSQYVNGRNVPSNLNCQRIARAFDLDPEWVMGFEPKKKTRTIVISRPPKNAKPVQIIGLGIVENGKEKKPLKITEALSKEEAHILSLYRSGKYKDIVSLMMDKM